jgi:hypothetical protein
MAAGYRYPLLGAAILDEEDFLARVRVKTLPNTFPPYYQRGEGLGRRAVRPLRRPPGLGARDFVPPGIRRILIGLSCLS